MLGPSVFFSDSGIPSVLKIPRNLFIVLWASLCGGTTTRKSSKRCKTFGILYLCSAIQHTADVADPGAPGRLQTFAQSRHGDQQAVIGATDALIRGFGDDLAPIRLARSAGLMAVQALPPLRHWLARRAMGLTDPLGALAEQSA